MSEWASKNHYAPLGVYEEPFKDIIPDNEKVVKPAWLAIITFILALIGGWILGIGIFSLIIYPTFNGLLYCIFGSVIAIIVVYLDYIYPRKKLLVNKNY